MASAREAHASMRELLTLRTRSGRVRIERRPEPTRAHPLSSGRQNKAGNQRELFDDTVRYVSRASLRRVLARMGNLHSHCRDTDDVA